MPPIEVQKLRPNLFLVTGANANTVVFVRSTDVVVIDTKGPRPWWGDAIADEVKRLTKLPITTIINTSASGDHVAGNTAFASSKIDIIAHEYAAADMRKMKLMFTKPTGGGLPTRTFKDRLTVGSGPDRLELYYFGAGHQSLGHLHRDSGAARPADRRRVRWQSSCRHSLARTVETAWSTPTR